MSGRIDSRAAYQAALSATVTTLDRALNIFDQDLGATGLGTRDNAALLAAAMTQAPAVQIRIVLHDAVPLQTRMPRLWDLCAIHAHRLQIRQTPRRLRNLTEFFLLNDRRGALIRTHADHWRARMLAADDPEFGAYAIRFAQLWAECSCCICTTRLGL